MISVIIAYRNDKFLPITLAALLNGTDHGQFEIIVVDDCSDEAINLDSLCYPNIRVIRNNIHRGVGYSFDRGVEAATNDTIILMGSDVVVKGSKWVQWAQDYVTNYRDSIGCSVCLSLDPEHLNPDNPANDIKRYGATILPFDTTEDLRSDSPLLDTINYYVGAFDAKWIKQIPTKDIEEVPCVYGAFYITTKYWYNRIRGWDTIKGMRLSGHAYWGGLEPWICIKSWLMGGRCHVIRELETGHIFSRGAVNSRLEYFWYNKMFIAWTMLPMEEADRLLKKVCDLRLKYDLPTRPFNMGKKLIRDNWMYGVTVRASNIRDFVHDFTWLCDKFNIKDNYRKI